MAFEQKEPLTTRIGNIIKEYKVDQILQELLQNCDDARAPHVFFLLDKREQKGPGLAQLKEVQEKAFRDSRVDTLQELDPDVGNEQAEFLLQQFKGPALYQYDYGVFLPEDFDSLERLGDGRKKHDPTATGKFCLGFNCVYHVTDMPSFVSGEWAVFLDPHKVLWRRENKADGTHEKVGGWKFNLKDMQEKTPEIVKTLRFLFDPFSLKFDVKPHEEYKPWDPTSTGEPWGGTCFRFPLRCKDEYVKKSQICRASQGAAQVVTAKTVEERVLIPYMNNAVERLLFMRSLESVVIYVWEEDAEKPDRRFKVSITDLDEPKREKRRAMINFTKRKMKEYRQEVAKEGFDEDAQRGLEPFMRFIRWLKEHASDAPRVVLPCRVKIEQKGQVKIQHWVLSTMIGGLEELDFASAQSVGGLVGPALADQCMWPYAAVAALLAEGEEVDEKGTKVYKHGNGGVMPGLEGKAFCTLPTPIFTGLPVHLDGRWELKTDRNNLIIDTQAQGLAKLQTYWNYLLIERVGAAAYARLLQQLAVPAENEGSLRHWLAQDKVKLKPTDFYRLFPSSQSSESDNVFKRIATPTFSLLSRPCGEALPVKLGETRVVPLSGKPSNNHEIAWRFFFPSEKETKQGVNFLRKIQVEERVGQESVGKDVMDLFALFDRDGSGYLSANEFRQGLVRVLTDSADLDINHLIDVADKDKDNQVSKEEFADILLTNLEKAKADALTHTDVRDEFGNTSIMKFRLLGIDKVTVSCLASVGDIFEGTPKPEGAVPEDAAQRQWKTVRDVTHQLFSSAVSVQSSLLQRGVSLTDASPEIYEELQRLPFDCPGERMHPASVRKWYQSSEFDDNAKHALKEFECGIRWPKGTAPTHLQDEQAVILLLIYCLSDLGSRGSSVLTEIQGCMLLPLRDGSLAAVPDAPPPAPAQYPGLNPLTDLPLNAPTPDKSKERPPLLLDTDAKDGNEAFGSRLVDAPEIFLARPAARVLSALDCAVALGCRPLGPTELARVFDRVLPKAWRHRERINAGELTEELRQKVVTFWSFLVWQAKDLNLLVNFGDWPLLQSNDCGLVQLSEVQSVVSIPDMAKQTKEKSVELKERATLLGVLGVPLLQSSNPDMANSWQVLQSELGDAGLAPLENALKTSKASLRWVSAKVDDVLALSVSQKQSFLRLLAQGQPDEKDLKLVRLLPLYKLQGSETTISLSDGTSYHTLPNFKVQGVDSANIAGVVFLEEPQPEWSTLYYLLGVTPLPRDKVYKEVFDHWLEYSQATRLQLLEDLRTHFGIIRDQKMADGETFASLLSRTPLFWSAAEPGKFSSVLELLDNSDLIVQALSPMFDHRLLPKELQIKAWEATLRDWGMPPHMPMTQVLISLRQHGKESTALAGVILKYIGQHCASLEKMDGEAWLDHLKELGDMNIAPSEQHMAQSLPSLKMPYPRPGEPLVPLNGARLCAKEDRNLVWSQQSLVRLPDPQPTRETLEGMGMDLEEQPKPAVVAAHFKVVMAAVRELLQNPVGKEAGTEGQPGVHDIMQSPGQPELTTIYSYFEQLLAEGGKNAANHQKLLADAGLGPNKACIIVLAQAMGDKDSRHWRITEPKNVFAFCTAIPGVEMYSLGYRSQLTRCSKLMSYLHITQRPLLEDFVAMMHTTAAKVEEGTAVEKQALLELSHEVAKKFGAAEAVHLIDVDYKVLRLNELILDNAEWLDGRIDKHLMHLLHSDLAEYAKDLNVSLLSEMVTEQLACVQPVVVALPQGVQEALNEIRRIASHVEFRTGMLRLINSCSLKPEKLEECRLKVYELDNLKIDPVSSIKSRFMLEGRDLGRRDVTAEAFGTPVLSSFTDNGLHVSIVFSGSTQAQETSLASFWLRVAQCLATYFGCHQKWAEVKDMLQVPCAEDIKPLLDGLRVPSMTLTTKAKWLGKPLLDLDWIVEDSNTSEFDLTKWLGELIAVFEDNGKEGFYLLASLLPIQESSLKEGPLNIDCGRSTRKQIQRGKIFAVKTEEQLTEMTLEREKLDALKNAEQLDAERQEREKQRKELAEKVPTEGEIAALQEDDKPEEVPQQPALPSAPGNEDPRPPRSQPQNPKQMSLDCPQSLLNPPETRRSYSSVYNNDAIGTGRARSMLDGPQAWSAGRKYPWSAGKKGDWMQINLLYPTSITGVIIQGRCAKDQWVTKFTVKYSPDGSSWHDVPALFTGTFDRDTKVTQIFAPVIVQSVRIVVEDFKAHVSMRAGLVVGCSQDCPQASLNPPETSRSYSSVWGKGYKECSMLDSPQAWVAAENEKGQWMQISLERPVRITGVSIQGHPEHDQWVTKFTVKHSLDGSSWNDVPVVFTGHHIDRSTKLTHFFAPVQVQHVRLLVEEWEGHISMRAGLVVGCSQVSHAEEDVQLPDEKRRKVTPDDTGLEDPMKPLDKTAIPEVPQGPSLVSPDVPNYEAPPPPTVGAMQSDRNNDKEGTPQEFEEKELVESQVKPEKLPPAAALMEDRTGMYRGPGTATVFIQVWYNPNLGVHDRLSAYSGQLSSIEKMQVWKAVPEGSNVDVFWMDRDNFLVGADWKEIPGVGPGQLLLSQPHIKCENGTGAACTLAKNRDDILYIKASDKTAHTGRLRFRIARQAPYNSLPRPYKTVEPWWKRPAQSPETPFCRSIDLSFRLDAASLKEAQVALYWIGVHDGMNFWNALSLIKNYVKGFSDMSVSAQERIAFPQSPYLTLMNARKGACGNRSSCFVTTALAAGIACRMVGAEGNAYVEFLLPPPASGKGPAPWKAPWTDWRMVDLGGGRCNIGGDLTDRPMFHNSGAIERQFLAEEKDESYSDETRKARKNWRQPDRVEDHIQLTACPVPISTHTDADDAALDDPEDSVAGSYAYVDVSSVRMMHLAVAQINDQSWPVLYYCSDVSDPKKLAEQGMEALQKLQSDVELCARMAEALCKSLPFAEDSLRKRLKLSIVASSQREMPATSMDQEGLNLDSKDGSMSQACKRLKLSSDASSQKEMPPTVRDLEGLHLDSKDWSTSQVSSSPSDPIPINVAHFAMLTEKLHAAEHLLESEKEAACKDQIGAKQLIYLQSMLMQKHRQELSMIAKVASPSELLECFGHSQDSICELSCAMLLSAFKLHEVVIQSVPPAAPVGAATMFMPEAAKSVAPAPPPAAQAAQTIPGNAPPETMVGATPMTQAAKSVAPAPPPAAQAAQTILGNASPETIVESAVAPASASAVPAPGGPVSAWKVDDVVRFLEDLQLGHVAKKFVEDAVDGAMLLNLSDEDLVSELGLSKLQAKKVKQRLPAA